MKAVRRAGMLLIVFAIVSSVVVTVPVALADGPVLTSSMATDAYEVDDTPELATSIAPGEVQWHNIGVAADEDWVSFPAQAGALYRVQVDMVDEVFPVDFLLADGAAVTLRTWGTTAYLLARADGPVTIGITATDGEGNGGRVYKLHVEKLEPVYVFDVSSER